MKKEYLNEENFQKVNNKIKSKGKLITNITLGIGIALILIGVILMLTNKSENNNGNVVDERQKIESQIALKEQELKTEKDNLKNTLPQVKSELNTKKQELINRGIKKSSDYNDGEAYDLYILDNALDPGVNYCLFDEYNKNEITADYCTLTNLVNGNDHEYTCEDNEIIEDYCVIKSELTELNYNKNNLKLNSNSIRPNNSIAHIPLIMIGFFVTVASLMVKFMLFSITHRREIMAYNTQHVMPIAQEGIEKMAPTIGKAGASMAKEMAPLYGDIAKEISKGIKEGLKDEEK